MVEWVELQASVLRESGAIPTTGPTWVTGYAKKEKNYMPNEGVKPRYPTEQPDTH